MNYLIDEDALYVMDRGYAAKLLASSNRRLKKSKGRQKLPECIPILMDYGENVAIVSPITKEHFTNKEKKI